MKITSGDWIVVNARGERYVYQDAAFRITFEQAADADAPPGPHHRR
jgi:hypothetical protein